MSGLLCIRPLGEKAIEGIQKNLKGIVPDDVLNTVFINTAVENILNNADGRLQIDDILSRTYLVADELKRMHSDSVKEKAAKELVKVGKINDTMLDISLSVSTSENPRASIKLDASQNTTTLYIYPDSAQARIMNNENSKFSEKDGVIANMTEDSKQRVKEAKGTWAAARNDVNGNKLDNTFGIVVRKNSITGVSQENSAASVLTEEDLEKFVQEITDNIKSIKESIEQRKGTDSAYTKVVLPRNFGAAMPQVLAEKLTELLQTELGIYSQLQKVGNTGKFKVIIPTTKREKTISEKEKNIADEAKESSKAERPTTTKVVNASKEKRDLKQAIPNIKTRQACITYFIAYFQEIADRLIDTAIEELKEEIAENPEEANSLYGVAGNLTKGEVLRGLTTGKVENRRYFAYQHLQYVYEENDMQSCFFLVDEILLVIKETFSLALDSLYAIYTDEGSINNSALNSFVNDILLNEDFIIGRYFEEECRIKFNREKKEDDGNNSYNRHESRFAIERAMQLYNTFKILGEDAVFESLLQEASLGLELAEGVSFDLSTERTSFANKTAESKKAEELDEDNVAVGKMDHTTKYRLSNPIDTLSKNMKRYLGSFVKTRLTNTGEAVPVFDFLGMPQRLNFTVVYSLLLDRLAGASNYEEFTNRLLQLEKEFPWLSDLVSKAVPIKNGVVSLNFDFDFRNELYRACVKTFISYGMITPLGRLSILNRSTSSEALYADAEKNYGGGLIFSDFSIYDDKGQINLQNITKLRAFLDSSYKGKDKKVSAEERLQWVKKNAPLGWALAIIDKVMNPSTSLNSSLIELLQEAINIFHNGKTININILLNSIGIDTSNISLEGLLPAIKDVDSISLQKDPKTGDLLIEKTKEGTEDLEGEKTTEPFITYENVQKLKKLVSTISSILNPRTGFKEGEHLTKHHKGLYLQIGTYISNYSEGYSSATFRFGEDSRYSYAVPNFIDRMCEAISSDRYELFIEDNYGKYDFYKAPGEKGEWRNTLLESLMGTTEESAALRKAFSVILILGFYGNAKPSTIGKISKKRLKEGIIDLFFNGNDSLVGSTKVPIGIYRNPLFSDTDAFVGFRYKRETGQGFEDKIIGNLIRLAKLELTRIINSEHTPKPNEKIEFYNDGKRNNSRKFNFLTFLNPHLEELKSYYKYDDYIPAAESDELLEERLKELIGNHMEESYERFTETIGDSFKISLAKRVKNNKTTNIEEEDIDSIFDGLEDLSDNENEEDVVLTASELRKALQKAEREALKLAGESLVKEFFYNDYYVHSLIIQLVSGDIALYKNFADFIKRGKQSFSGGERVYAWEENIDNNSGTISRTPLIERGIYMADVMRVSNTYSSIMQLVNNSELDEFTKALIRGTLHSINTTDGQSLRTLKSFKTIYKAMGGMWTDEMEEAYQRITLGEVTIADFNTLFQPIKPFVYSHESRKIDGVTTKVNTQHKNSEYLISAMYTMLNNALNKSAMLKGLNRFMEDYDIDAVHFHSVVKEGYNNGIDVQFSSKAFSKMLGGVKPTIEYVGLEKTFYWKDAKVKFNGIVYDASSYSAFLKSMQVALEKGNISMEDYNKILKNLDHTETTSVKNGVTVITNTAYEDLKTLLEDPSKERDSEQFLENLLDQNVMHYIPMSDYMIMQPTTDHLVDALAVFGSQLRNITVADLPLDFTCTIDIRGDKVTLHREEVVALYNKLITDNYIDSFKKLLRKFSSLRSMSAEMQAKMAEQPAKYTRDIRKALEINPITGRLNAPVNMPNLKNKIEELILSTFKNHIQRQKINGGNAVLVSNYGLHKDLRIVYKKDKEGNETIDHFECYMSHTMQSQLVDFLEEKTEGGVTYQVLSFEKMKRVLGESKSQKLLEAIGYRIPTEDKYSIVPLRIVGFLPSSAGCAIMLPSDIVGLSGSDFDIDKLFLMFRSIRRESYRGSLRSAYKKWLEEKAGVSLSSENSIGSAFESVFATLKALLEEAEEDIDEDTDIDIENDSALKKLLRKTDNINFTDNEIESLRTQSDLFEEFMREAGDKYLIRDKQGNVLPLYRVLEPKVFLDKETGKIDLEKSTSSLNKAQRDNLLIEVISAIFKTKTGSLGMVTPGNFEGVIRSSAVEKVLGDKGALAAFMDRYKDADFKNVREWLYTVARKEGGVEELDALYEEYATGNDPLNPDTWLQNHQNLMAGNDLIGMFAVNSSAHLKLQFAPLTVKEEYAISIDGEKITLDAVHSPFNNQRRIGEICAQLQAAAPDNGKNPRLGDMNVSTETILEVCILSRWGLNEEDIGMIINTKQLRDLASSINIRELNLSKEQWEYIKRKDLNLDRLASMKAILIHEGGAQYLLQNHPVELIAFQLWYNTLRKIGKDLSSGLEVIRCDSANGALSSDYAEAILLLIRIDLFFSETIRHEKFSLEGFENLIDHKLRFEDASTFKEKCMLTPIPRLQAVFSLGLVNAPEIAAQFLPCFSSASLQRVKLLLNHVDKDAGKKLLRNSNTAVMKKFLTSMEVFLLSQEPLFTQNKDIMDIRNYYIHDFPIQYKLLMLSKNEDGTLAYPNIVNSPIIKRISNRENKGLKLDNMGKIDPELRKYYTEAFEELLLLDTTNEKEKEVAKQLAVDLLMYAYFDNGLTFRHNSYSNYFSTEFLSGIESFVDTYSKVNDAIRAFEQNKSLNFIQQFLVNNPGLVTILDLRHYSIEGGIVTMKRASDGKLPDGIYINNLQLDNPNLTTFYKSIIIVFKQEVKEDGKKVRVPYLAKLIQTPRGLNNSNHRTVQYEILDVDIKKLQKSPDFYDASKRVETIQYSNLKERGNAAFKLKSLEEDTSSKHIVDTPPSSTTDMMPGEVFPENTNHNEEINEKELNFAAEEGYHPNELINGDDVFIDVASNEDVEMEKLGQDFEALSKLEAQEVSNISSILNEDFTESLEDFPEDNDDNLCS